MNDLRSRQRRLNLKDEDIYTVQALIQSVSGGDYSTKYCIDDTISILTPTYGTLQMQIVAFDSDELTDGSGYAPVSLVCRHLVDVAQKWNEANTNAGGYPNCTLRTWLNTVFASEIQSIIGTEHLASVKKSSYGPANTDSPQNNDPRSTLWSDELAWILSAREWGRTGRESAGVQYPALAKSALGKNYNIRSTFTSKTTTLDFILANGIYGTDYSGITTARPQRIGFCLK